jgi:hypothetical protein
MSVEQKLELMPDLPTAEKIALRLRNTHLMVRLRTDLEKQYLHNTLRKQRYLLILLSH